MLHLFALYLPVSSPSSLSVDPDADVASEADAAPEYDYVPDDSVDNQPLAPELAGKHPILSIPISPILFSLMLALELLLLLLYLF